MNGNLKTIVIGTTLNTESESIIRAGAAIARATGATTYIIHAYSLPAFPSELGAFDGQWIEEQTAALRQRLTQQAEDSGIAGMPGFQPVNRVSQSGPGAGASGIGSLRTPLISCSPKETRATRSSRTHSTRRLIGISCAWGVRSQLWRKTRTTTATAM